MNNDEREDLREGLERTRQSRMLDKLAWQDVMIMDHNAMHFERLLWISSNECVISLSSMGAVTTILSELRITQSPRSKLL